MSAEALKSFLSKLSKELETPVSQVKDMEVPGISVIPSGSHTIDYALGVGGYPRGRIIEIFGRQSSGKTLLSWLAIAEAQKLGGTAAFLDVEHSGDLLWASKLGVDVKNLVFHQPDSAEQTMTLIERMAQSNLFDVIVLDSVAGLITQQEMDKEYGEQTMALQARFLSQSLRRLVPVVGKSKTVLIFINQVRKTLNMYGEQEATTGGMALPFYSSIRLEVKKASGSEIKDGDLIIGHRVHINVKKNKVAPPMQQAEFTLRFTKGVDHLEEIVQLGLLLEVIAQKGAYYYFGDLKVNGFEELVNVIRESADVQAKLVESIQKAGKTNEDKPEQA